MTTDLSFKVLAGGAGGVGKTTFLYRYLTQTFVPDTKLTVGVQLHSHVTERQGKSVSLVMWDLGGQDRFRFVQPSYMRGASAAFAFYDTTRIGTLGQLRNWVADFRKHGSPAMPIVLVGTKADIAAQDDELMTMAIEEAEQVAFELELQDHVVTSSKTGANVQEAVTSLVDTLLAQRLGAAIRDEARGIQRGAN